MAFEDYKTKDSVVIAYTGEGKGKTSASLGLLVRALGAGWYCAYIQFIKHWEVSEHKFIKDIQGVYGKRLYFYKGGKGFYNAKELSAKNVSDKEHAQAARSTYQTALECASSGKYQLVVCDEINNAVSDGLLQVDDIRELINSKSPKTSLCLTGRDFPDELIELTDIATNMQKLKHHFDNKFLANKGVDF